MDRALNTRVVSTPRQARLSPIHFEVTHWPDESRERGVRSEPPAKPGAQSPAHRRHNRRGGINGAGDRAAARQPKPTSDVSRKAGHSASTDVWACRRHRCRHLRPPRTPCARRRPLAAELERHLPEVASGRGEDQQLGDRSRPISRPARLRRSVRPYTPPEPTGPAHDSQPARCPRPARASTQHHCRRRSSPLLQRCRDTCASGLAAPSTVSQPGAAADAAWRRPPDQDRCGESMCRVPFDSETRLRDLGLLDRLIRRARCHLHRQRPLHRHR